MDMPPMMTVPARDNGKTRVVLACLFLSGVAAIINQTVWQRALKVYLAGSETLSSMIVVLVFMLGLGLGSWLMGKRAGSIKNPVGLLGAVELALLAINVIICLALSFNVAAGANALQQAAHAIGMPLRLLYTIVSTMVLLVPCILMGITMPLASEGAQVQLGHKDSRFLTTLFLLNTLGAVAGGLMSGFILLPYFGQKASLLVAAGLNGFAGLGLLLLRLKTSVINIATTQMTPLAEEVTLLSPLSRRPLSAGFALGFLALAYEMLLFRLAAIIYLPLPYTFAVTLVVYLLLWSSGLWLARFRSWNLSIVLLVTTGLVAFVPQLNFLDHFRISIIHGFDLMPWLARALTLLPCVGFGLAFGRVLADNAYHWGKDVGRFYFMNTMGSALGILLATLIGFRFHPMFLGWGIGLGYMVLMLFSRTSPAPAAVPKNSAFKLLVLGVVVVWVVYASQMAGYLAYMHQPDSRHRMYFSPEGIVEVSGRKQMFWDGLWHSDLSVDGDHVGTNNWLMAVIPFLCHSKAADGLDGLVVGLGTGITAETLARFPLVRRVDTYEINLSLKRLLADFPKGTLGVLTDSKVNIMWGDGRTGMAINQTKYDIITQQPLYLKQAGSSILLSREYMELVKSRLKPGGIFAIYCNTFGMEGQGAILRRTAAEVFPYYKSFGDGYLLVVSNEPFGFDPHVLKERLAALPSDSIIRNEVNGFGMNNLVAYLDDPPLRWDATNVMVTDDHPVVEYPNVAEALYRRGH